MYQEEWLKEFANKKIAIWGFGMEGKSSYRFIRSLLPTQELTIVDRVLSDAIKETEYTTFLSQEECDFKQFDLILKAPGIVVSDEMLDLPITGQAPLFLKHYRKQTIGVTGTKGKSTTTSLIHAVLNQKYHTHLVGNIGKACFDIIPDLKEEDYVAFEISCHQLEFSKYSPHIAVYLNLFEEHLDHYGSFERYGNAKDQIFLHQEENDILLIGNQIKERTNKKAIVIGEDITINNHEAFYQTHHVSLKDTNLIGTHNEMNLAISYAIGQLLGISDEQFLHAIKEFEPLPHRLQVIAKKKGITFVDDSISTIGQSCISALESLPETKSVLIGGMDRGINYEELEEYLSHRNDLCIIFMYQTGKRIYEEMQAKQCLPAQVFVVEDLEEAVKVAIAHTKDGEICLLSPAASSYDHFKNFEERGDCFKQLVLNYVEID